MKNQLGSLSDDETCIGRTSNVDTFPSKTVEEVNLSKLAHQHETTVIIKILIIQHQVASLKSFSQSFRFIPTTTSLHRLMNN
jgi:hypothetical protein